MFKNIEYDISKITKSLEEIKLIDSVERYTYAEATGKSRYPLVDRHLYKTMLGETVLKISRKEMENRVRLEEEKGF